MAKSVKTSKKPKAMPHLAAAVICERVIRETDSVCSAIRIVDNITIRETPAAGELVVLPLFLLLSFKRGLAKGKRQLNLSLVTPSGKRHAIARASIEFSGAAEGGITTDLPVTIKWESDGLYWFDVAMDSRAYTRIPIRVKLPEASP